MATNDDSDSDYVVEEYIKPDKIAKPVKNGASEDLLGNFKDIQKEQKIYGTFPKEVFEETFDHDQKLDILDGKMNRQATQHHQLIFSSPFSSCEETQIGRVEEEDQEKSDGQDRQGEEEKDAWDVKE